jgi:hypothetical protein
MSTRKASLILLPLHPRNIHQVHRQLHFGPFRPTLAVHIAPPSGSSSTLNLLNRRTDPCLHNPHWLDLHLNLHLILHPSCNPSCTTQSHRDSCPQAPVIETRGHNASSARCIQNRPLPRKRFSASSIHSCDSSPPLRALELMDYPPSSRLPKMPALLDVIYFSLFVTSSHFHERDWRPSDYSPSPSRPPSWRRRGGAVAGLWRRRDGVLPTL